MMKEKSQRKSKIRAFRAQAYRYMAIALSFAMLISMVPVASVGAAAYSPFHDVATDYWGLQHITKSEIRGVISGYGNGIFKPEQTVTMLEAVIMAVNAMGLKEDTKTAYNIETSKYTLPTAWDASGYLAVALTEGLIRPNDVMAFRHDAGASRAWTALLLVRALGLDGELRTDATTTFNDDASIPTWARPSVALASDKGIILGMAATNGGYEYRPNIAVKRAELATLISKSDRYMNTVKGQLPLGVIESVDTAARTVTIVKTDKTKATYNIDATSALYDDSFANNSITINSLATEMPVRFSADGSKLKYLEAVNASYYSNLPTVSNANKISAYMVQLFPEYKELVVDVESSSQPQTMTYVDKVVVYDQTNARQLELADLVAGDQLDLSITDNKITRIDVVKAKQDAILKGAIYVIDTDAGWLTIERNNKRSTYYIDDRVTVDYAGIRFATLADLTKGDEVELKLEKDMVVQISLVQLYQENNFTGQVVEISIPNRILTVLMANGQPEAYKLTNQTAYIVPNVVAPTINDVQVKDQVKLEVNGKDIVRLEVVGHSADAHVTGQLSYINSSLKQITVESKTGELLTYRYDDKLEIYIDGENTGRLADIKVGDNIALDLGNDGIKRISINTMIEGTIVTFNQNLRTIVIKTDGVETIYEFVAKDLDIHILDITRPAISDLAKGMEVSAKLVNNQIKKLVVKETKTAKLKAVDPSWNRIEIIDPDTDKALRYYVYSDTEVIVAGVKNATIKDLDEKGAVELNFEGYDIVKVTYIPPMSGVITKAESKANNVTEITVENEIGSETVKLDSKSDIYLTDTKGNLGTSRVSASNLKVGDYVYAIVIGDQAEVHKAHSFQVEYYGSTKDSISYYDSSRNFRNISRIADLTIWKASTGTNRDLDFYLLGDIKAGDKIELYQLDGDVVGIMRK